MEEGGGEIKTCSKLEFSMKNYSYSLRALVKLTTREFMQKWQVYLIPLHIFNPFLPSIIHPCVSILDNLMIENVILFSYDCVVI